MKIKSQDLVTNPNRLSPVRRLLLCTLLTLPAAIHPQKAEAASQTWTNAPADNTWTNIHNWVGLGVPGNVNPAPSGLSADMATFTNSIPASGIGGAANWITNDFQRDIGGMIFDTASCGAYVFGSSLNDNFIEVTHSHYIAINSPVTSPIVFNEGVQVRLPNSTNGRYDLTNNAATTTATFFFAAITNTSASTRPLSLYLNGSNTGTNTIAHIDDQTGTSGAIHLYKEGTGRWILSGPNDLPQKTSGGDGVPANVLVQGGILEVEDPGSLGTITMPNIRATNGGTLLIDGVTLNNTGVTLQNNGTVQMNGSGTVNGITVATSAGTSVTLATTSATDVMTIGNAANTMTGGAPDSVLHIGGPGTVLLSQPANYAGNLSVDAGTNQLGTQGALGTGANLNVNAGAVFDTTPIGATTYTLDTKGFSANGAGTAVGSTAATVMADPAGTIAFGSASITLTFTPVSFTGDSGHPALYCSRGTLSFNGNAITVNNASGTPLGAGTYQLVSQATGSIVSSGAFVTIITGSGLAAGTIAEIKPAGGNLNLVVSAYTPKSLVWTGNDPLLPGVWDRQNSTNWLAGGNPSTFNIYDSVTFNATGSAQPTVSLADTMVPSSVTVDTSANNYTFTGAGQIAGGTSLVKINTPGTLVLQTANTYSGGTIVSNGVVQLGIDNGVSSTGPAGTNDVALYSPGVFDLNNFANTINGLNGSGTVDITGGSVSTLTIGFNGDSGLFSGAIQNTSGTLNITKVGTGSETLTHSNSYTGTTDIELGTLRATDPNALGAGASPLVINSGALDIATNLAVASLAGAGGVIANLTTTTTNNLLITSNLTTSFGGSIGGGHISLTVLGGSLRMTAANTYSNGTFVGSGATFQIHNGPASVTGPLIASNTATLGLSGGSSTPGTPTSITTVDGGTVTFTSGAEGNIWTGQFIGSATATNVFSGPESAGGIDSFSNFLGLVRINLSSGNFRFFNGGGISGGDNTTFEFDAGNVHTRDAQLVSLGAVTGGSSSCGIGGNGTAGTVSTWIIGAKNLDCSFEGYINGSNNLVKAGTGTLTLDGATITTNTDSSTYTNYSYAPVIAYLGTTTVSNGVLALVAPNDFTNATTITLASTNAILDTSRMGYLTSITDPGGNTDFIPVTNGVLTVLAANASGIPQTLGGIGLVRGNGVTNYGIIDPGFATAGGTLTISNQLAISAGATNSFDLSDDPTGLVKPSDLIMVQGNVALSGNSTIAVNGLNGVLNLGKYPLIKYSGNLSNETGVVPPGPVPNFTLGGTFPATSRATLVLTNGPGEVDLGVVSLNSTNLTWQGDGVSNLWDVVNSFNWTNSFGAAMQFYQLDNVAFASTSPNAVITLQGTVVPGSVTVTGGTNYVFGGPGSIGGDGTLTMSGTGSLALTNGANSYAGGTVINSGVLRVGTESGGNQNDLALGTGLVTVNSGAELRFGGNGGSVVNHFITNNITVNGGVIRVWDGAQHLTNSTVTIGASGGTFETVFSTKNLVLDSPLSGAGNLTVGPGTNTTGGQVVLDNGSNTLTGSVTILANANLALVGLGHLSNSPAIDVQLGGIFDISARSNAAWSVTSGQTLKGNGLIRGKFITAAAGSIIAPGVAGAIGTLTVTNQGNATNFAVVTLAGTASMDINRAAAPNCDRIVNVNGTNVMGGTLTVNNLGAALVAGDSFQLLVGGVNTGSFATLNLPPLSSGLIWSNSLAVNGKLTVIATVLVPTIPPAITNFSLSGANVVISGTNGQAGYTYYLLATTNLTNPRAQWHTVATNVLGASNYTFTGTNAVTSGFGQQFYMLSSTNYNP